MNGMSMTRVQVAVALAVIGPVFIASGLIIGLHPVSAGLFTTGDSTSPPRLMLTMSCGSALDPEQGRPMSTTFPGPLLLGHLHGSGCTAARHTPLVWTVLLLIVAGASLITSLLVWRGNRRHPHPPRPVDEAACI
jgi:hypothetical protein